jgi:hypothetical protein
MKTGGLRILNEGIPVSTADSAPVLKKELPTISFLAFPRRSGFARDVVITTNNSNQ